ncbi:putative transporter AmpG 1 [Hydractinia symbiolongicarpus]|uniref:putative transporter AmpG 1 n=1 Tax=Hydractinia symbiolongicarpus TaxID=13093 RepID=UPI0025503867|nr:putative transporter AmpG 1 [Hydractinia symbiolongicarpus]
MLSQTELLQWKKKRTSTFLVFVVFYFLIGLELGCINATLWIYVSTLLKTGNDKLYYGLITAAFYVPSLFFPPIVTRFVDKTRRMKLCFIGVLCLSIAGSILYPIHTSPVFPLAGRFLSGFNIAFAPVIISEVARSFTSKELMQRIPLLNGIIMIGYAFGPCVSILFINIDFWIGEIHITYANVIGPVLFLISVAILLSVVFLSYDLSREYDMKRDTTEVNEYTSSKPSRSESTMDIMKRILQTADALLIITLSVFYGIVDQIMFRVLPILIIDKLNFSYAFLNWSFVALSALSTALVLVLVCWKMSDKQLYYTGLVSVISIMIVTSLQLLTYHKVGNEKTWYLWIIITLFALILFLLSDQAFSVVICAKLAFSYNQGFIEGVRTFAVQSGRIIGGLLIGVYFEYMNVFYIGINVVLILFLFVMISRRRSLSNPVPVI